MERARQARGAAPYFISFRHVGPDRPHRESTVQVLMLLLAVVRVIWDGIWGAWDENAKMPEGVGFCSALSLEP